MRSVDRTLALFELFSERQNALTLSQVARLLEIPVSTCFNLLRSLQDSGYLFEVEAKAFYPTGRLLQTAQVISDHDPSRIKIAPQLELLRGQTGETVLLTKQIGQRIMLLNVLLLIRHCQT